MRHNLELKHFWYNFNTFHHDILHELLLKVCQEHEIPHFALFLAFLFMIYAIIPIIPHQERDQHKNTMEGLTDRQGTSCGFLLY